MSWIKLSWEKLAAKWKVIVCSIEATAPPPVFLTWIDLNQRLKRGEITVEQAAGEIPIDTDPLSDIRVMWEPLSDKRGDPILVAGWDVSATMYLLNGQPWWLVRATRAQHHTEKQREVLDKIVSYIGGDPIRDVFLAFQEDDDGPETIWFTWFNQAPLWDIQLTSNKHTTIKEALLVVPRGSPIRAGYERMPPLPSFSLRSEVSEEDLGKTPAPSRDVR